jgi:hypothetical protein
MSEEKPSRADIERAIFELGQVLGHGQPVQKLLADWPIHPRYREHWEEAMAAAKRAATALGVTIWSDENGEEQTPRRELPAQPGADAGLSATGDDGPEAGSHFFARAAGPAEEPQAEGEAMTDEAWDLWYALKRAAKETKELAVLESLATHAGIFRRCKKGHLMRPHQPRCWECGEERPEGSR